MLLILLLTMVQFLEDKRILGMLHFLSFLLKALYQRGLLVFQGLYLPLQQSQCRGCLFKLSAVLLLLSFSITELPLPIFSSFS